MNLPCEKWLEALITIEPAYSNKELAQAVLLRGFPKPLDAYLDALRARQAQTKPAPYDPKALHCIRWLRDLRVYDYIRNDAHVRKAVELLGLEQVRAKVETLLLGRVHPADLPTVIQEFCGVHYPTEAYAYYRHYFWNPGVMSPVAWKLFFKQYANGELLESVFLADDQNAALAKAGIGLNMDVGEVLDFLAADAFARYKALGHSAIDQDVRQAAKVWGHILLRTSELKVKSGDVSAKLIELLESIQLETEQDATKTVHELKRKGDLIALPGRVQTDD